MSDPKAPQWWRNGVIYQIYPRSFLDTNGDGIGDLKGCIEKLDYIASLGVDGIWLSPFFTSPMDDFGYDISDHCAVDPIFGTLGDFDRFLNQAHRRRLKVIIDQVYSHTSEQHRWFHESRQDKNNSKANWYVWANPNEDGTPPNNWQSVFGGGAWEWDARRRQYYFHNFLKSQPDLNLHNHEVQDALLNVARFWLDRGVDGFRLDAINFAMHDPDLRDNPVNLNPETKRTRPIDFQIHRYSQSHPDIPKFLERLTAIASEYDTIFTVAEIGGPDPLPEMRAFTDGKNRLKSAYGFNFLYSPDLTPALVKKASLEWRSQDGWPSWAFSNHDSPRSVSRWSQGRDRDKFAKLSALILLTLRGTPIIYQGEELGLEQGIIKFDDLQDPEAIKNWPETLGRDGSRTPIPWKKSDHYLGFSTTKPWLPIAEQHTDYTVDHQDNDHSSVLNTVRKIISVRKKSSALGQGSINFLPSKDGLLVYVRSYEDEKILVVANLGDQTVTWEPPKTQLKEILFSVNLPSTNVSSKNELPPMGAYIAHLEDSKPYVF